jgi:hypothetical protein
LAEQSETGFEKFMGFDVSRQATSELRDLYLREGKASEGAAATQRLQQIADRTAALIHSFSTLPTPQLHVLERKAILVQSSAIVAVFLVFAAAFALLALELRHGKHVRDWLRLRGAICLAADWAPVALLAACAAMLWAFQPFAQILRSAHNVESASAAWQTMHFEGLFVLAGSLEPFTPYHFWQATTVTLIVLALFLLVRGFLRHKYT